MRCKINILCFVIYTCLGICCDAHSALKIEKASFPTSVADIGFAQKMKVLTEDYKTYEGLSPYEMLLIKRLDEKRQQDQMTMPHENYCDEYPLVPECNPSPATEEAIIASGYEHVEVPAAVSVPVENITPSVENNHSIIGGKCTPSERYQYFDRGDWHKLTSHRYDASNPPFAKAMFNLLRVERPECHTFSNKNGGKTCYGFSSVYNPDIDVTSLTLNSAEDRTYKLFYRNTGIYKLPDYIMGDVMHASFWRGADKGVRTLYRILGVSCGNRCSVVSDDLATRAKNYTGDLRNEYWDKTWTEMQSYESNRPYLKGFSERIKMMRQNGCHSPNNKPITF